MMTRSFIMGATLLLALQVATSAKEQPVSGWRGDGNGRYPEANPPLNWGRVAGSVKELSAQAAKPRDDAAPAKVAAIPDGVIRNWLVLGPIPLTADMKSEEPIPNAASLSPDENDKVGESGWKAVTLETSVMDLCSLLNVAPDKKGMAAYAHAYVYSPSGRPVVYNALSQGQGCLRVWLNGEEVYFTGKNVNLDAFGMRASLQLKKGWNSLMTLNAKTLGDRKSWWISGSLYGQQTDDFETHGIVWSTVTPSPGASAPVIAGDRLFFTAERGSVVCANKADGKLLWIRSVSYYDFATEEERKANPAVFADLDPLAEKVKQMDQSDLMSPWKPPALEKDLRWNVDERLYFKGMSKVSSEKYNNPATWGCEAGYTAHTPVTDGRFVYALFGSGIVACFDLDGNRRWTRLLQHKMIEHGYTTSPLLVDGKLVIYFDNFTVLDADTGAVILERPRSGRGGFCGTACVLPAGNEKVLYYPNGEFVRLSDGKSLALDNKHLAPLGQADLNGSGPASPVVEKGTAYLITKRGFYGGTAGVASFRLPALQGDKVEPEILRDVSFNTDGFPYYYEPFFDASPLLHEGLFYCLNDFGLLTVVDMTKGEVLYQRQLDIEIFMPYNGGLLKGGASASPTLAGKYIFIWGNQGTCVVLEPGRTFKQVARMRLESRLPGYPFPGRQAATMSNPVFEGERMYYRAEYTLYCIGPR